MGSRGLSSTGVVNRAPLGATVASDLEAVKDKEALAATTYTEPTTDKLFDPVTKTYVDSTPAFLKAGLNYSNTKSPANVAEAAAIAYYQGKGAEAMNKHLRGEATLPSVPARVAMLDNALKKTSTPEDMVVKRGLHSTYLPDMKIGDVYQDKGYLSTTGNMRMHWGDAEIRIFVPKGSQAVPVAGRKLKHQNEQEVILGRNQKLKVLGFSVERGRKIVHARLLG